MNTEVIVEVAYAMILSLREEVFHRPSFVLKIIFETCFPCITISVKKK